MLPADLMTTIPYYTETRPYDLIGESSETLSSQTFWRLGILLPSNERRAETTVSELEVDISRVPFPPVF